MIATVVIVKAHVLYKGDVALSGKVALVTGGSRGIGLAIARALLAEGVRVAITATSDATLHAGSAALAAALPSAGRAEDVFAIRADVRRHEQVDRAVASAVERFGGIDILVNNAGVGIFKPVADLSVDEWHTMLDTNLTGVFYCCRAALPHLRARGGGWIVNISSLSGKHPFADAAAYCASKAGLNAFSDALMQEVRHDGIRVTCIMPGSVRTEFGARRPGSDDWRLAPEDVAQAVCDAVRHPSRSLPSAIEIRPSQPPKKS
jgi:NAD(P)-dependent dehydrogenase (short-subunit alcohol dehydrogenase family)